MAKDIYLNPLTNDIDLTNKRMRLTESIPESSRQQVYIDLHTFQGEWYANILAGVPYLANDTNAIQLLGKTSKDTFDITIKGNILSRENIISLTSYSSELNKATRNITINFVAKTNTGEEITIQNLPIGF